MTTPEVLLILTKKFESVVGTEMPNIGTSMTCESGWVPPKVRAPATAV